MTSQDSREKPLVTIVVPTYDSARTLRACLEALKKQTYPYTEVLVVDNYSRDETRRLAAKFGVKVILHRGTQAAAKNAGLAQSNGSYVLFVDSDQELGSTVVEDCVLQVKKNCADAIKIPETFVGVNFWGKCSALWKNHMVKAWGPKGGIPRFYRKAPLLKQLAFNDELRWGEDMELHKRLRSDGLKEAWCASRLLHYETDSLQNVARKYLSYGQSVTAFRRNQAEASYIETFGVTLFTVVQMLRDTGRSVSIFWGCLFLVTVKSLSAGIGFLSRID